MDFVWLTNCCVNLKMIEGFVNSNFTTALLGSLAGAWAGAYAAQRIAEKMKREDEFLKEIRDTNAATTLAFTICNSMLTLKSQHLVSMKKDYELEKNKILEIEAKRKSGKYIAGVIEFNADLRTLPIQKNQSDLLCNIVFDRLSVSGRPLALVTSIIESTDALNTLIRKRNELIENYKFFNANEKENLVKYYFGLDIDGGINLEYPDTLNGIFSHVNHVIYFSKKLTEELKKHGERIKDQYVRVYKKEGPKVGSVSLEIAEKNGLLPNSADYASWETSFMEIEKTEKKSLLFRMKTFLNLKKIV